MDKNKFNTVAGNQTIIDPTKSIISTYITNSLTQYNVPTNKFGNLLDETNVEDSKAWVDENHK